MHSRLLKRDLPSMVTPVSPRTATGAATTAVIGARHAALTRGAARPVANHVFSTIVHTPSHEHERRSALLGIDVPQSLAAFKHAVQQRQQQRQRQEQLEEANAPIWDNPIPHAVYDLNTIAHIETTHHEPTKLHEKAALFAVKTMRTGFDLVSGYRGPGGGMTERDWLNRCLFLETVAGVPGMVAGMARHLRSLRSLKRDYGWIHTLLEEAENERMHLLIFMNMKQPGWMFRMMVLGAQGVFFNAFFFTYLASPRTCHRFVGYLEEEAVKTYTSLLQDIEDGHLKEWEHASAPLIARNYYKLPDNAPFVDVLKCIRADEANHRDVNHTFASLDQRKGVNPFIHGH